MEIKLQQLVNSQGILNVLSSSKGLKTVVAYRIAKNIQLIEPELKNYYEQIQTLIKKYSNGSDDNGQPTFESDKEVQKFNKELEDLLNETCDLNIKTISIEDLADVELTPADILGIDYMLNEED